MTARARRPKAPLEVWKFGGASLADATAIARAASLIAAHPGPLVVVCSAMAGVTDQLLAGARQAVAGDERASARTAAALLARHRKVAEDAVPRNAGPSSRRSSGRPASTETCAPPCACSVNWPPMQAT
jgi:aspartokinase